MALYSFIIPYQHSPERYPLLLTCLEELSKYTNSDFEVCIHEIGPQRTLILPLKYKVIYTQLSTTFHRAWALNKCVRKLATGNTLILMDGDLVLNQFWFNELLTLDLSIPYVGWGSIDCLSQKGTKTFISTRYYTTDQISKVKTPSLGSAAGAITVIPLSLFNEVKGFPEDFTGSWGGEDNTFWSKLKSFNYTFSTFSSRILHLFHSSSTPRVRSIQKKAISMIYWNKDQWKAHLKVIDDEWGKNLPPSSTPSLNYISTHSDAKLTMMMLSWLRPQKLIETLTSLNEVLTIPVNLVLMIQGSERLEKKQKEIIRDLSKRFYRYDIFFTQGNIGTGPARHTLLTRALTRFRSKYFNFSDDDTTFTKGSVEAAIDLLEDDLSIGIVGIRYKQNIYRLDSNLSPKILDKTESHSSIEPVDSTGSASAIIRREVFDLCFVDNSYKLGYWDLDLCLQARSVGWKIVNYRAFAGMKAINNFGGCSEYRRTRTNKDLISKSFKTYSKKWGLIKSV